MSKKLSEIRGFRNLVAMTKLDFFHHADVEHKRANSTEIGNISDSVWEMMNVNSVPPFWHLGSRIPDHDSNF